MILLATLASLHLFSFKGGTVYQLLDELSQERRAPVALMYSNPYPTSQRVQEPQLKPFHFEYLDETQLINRIARKLEVDSQGRKQFAFAPDSSLDLLSSFRAYREPADSTERWPDKPNKDGTITLKCRKPVRLEESLGELWPKPIKTSTLFRGAKLMVEANATPPEELFRLIAATVGAKPILSDKEWRLAFDAKEYRRRAGATLDRRLATDRGPNHELLSANIALFKAALGTMSDDDLERAVETKDNAWQIDSKALSPLGLLIQARLAAYSQAQFGGETPGATNNGSRYVEMLDTSRPIQVFVHPQTLQVSVGGSVKGKKSMGIEF